ncbi:hypothetical protein AB0B74_03395 [Micromonospora parva]|uniref:hypothetical protein n=1 Tax=Micromonospora parva TaxID=1464048 RepID=UPI0034095721
MFRRAFRRWVGGAVAVGAITFAALFVAPGPAQAYGSLTMKYALVDTDNCQRLEGNLTVIAESGGCRLNDSADGTYFVKDPGGVAMKIEMRDSNGMVAKFEFHPYDEKLWYYDTRNDGDTLYVTLCGIRTFPCTKVYAAPGTSNVIDYGVADFDIAEDDGMSLTVYDDANGVDWVAGLAGGYS